MKKRVLTIVGITIICFCLIQLIPVNQTNPAAVGEITAPPHITSILKRSCYDCHSHETVWPWYSNVAPVSWLVAWDVKEGREELNFSAWNQYRGKKRDKKLKEITEEVDEEEMPPWFYLPLHPEARLSPQDRQRLQEWAKYSVNGTPNDEDDE